MRVLVIVPVLLAMLAAPGTAQEPKQKEPLATIHACYVPLTGTIYRIKEAGLRPACASPAHVEFWWLDGEVDLATQIELDRLQQTLAARGTINARSNPVDWSQLKGVPAGFADGVDDAGGTAGSLDCVGCVGTDELASDAVTSGKIADGTVQSDDIAANTVRGGLGGNVAPETITGYNIAEGGVEQQNLAVGAVRERHIAPQAVTEDAIDVGAVTWRKIAFDAVRGAHVQDGSITAEDLADGAIEARDVAVASGTWTVDFGLFAPLQCKDVPQPEPRMDGNDVLVVDRAPGGDGNLDVTWKRVSGSVVEFRACNPLDPSLLPYSSSPVRFNYIVFGVS